jgi:hypothetical protein
MSRAVPVILSLALAACSADEPSEIEIVSTVESSAFEVVDNPRATDAGFREFTQYIDMNGLGVYGEEGVSEEKMLYVAAIFAELLDNDEDGTWDDSPVFSARLAQEALMPIFVGEGSAAEEEFFEHYDGDGVSAVLYDDEVDPSNPGHWGDDATIEETMHTINHVGHASVYPDVFGLDPGASRLTEAMDIARGGQWLTFPDDYPEEAWYHYDDWTCDYQCMAIEYIYWAQVSHLGILDDPQTCQGIANEWELCSAELLQAGDVLIYAVITDPAQPLPQKAPDGTYAPNAD